MNTVVLFDIDHTLFDTRKFLGKVYKKFSEDFGSNPKIIKRAVEEVRKELGYFDFMVFFKKLATKIKQEEAVIKRIFYDENILETSLYKESKDVLQILSRGNVIGIFSQGFNKFQRAKLLTLEHLLQKHHVHVVLNKHTMLPKIISKYKSKELYLVDDALLVLHAAKKLDQSIFTIWVNRGRIAKKQKPITGFKPDATVRNLKQVIKIIIPPPATLRVALRAGNS